MAAQDDEREREMRTLFNLTKPEKYAGRGDVDAVLELEGAAVPDEFEGREILFELKSATSGRLAISTVRDFGLHYLVKWRPLHWLFGIYDRDAKGDLALDYCLYGSPAAMAPWFDAMAEYITPDVALAGALPELITDDTLSRVLGDSEDFGYEEARQLLKNQRKRDEYREAADLPDERYSRTAMLQLLRERAQYLVERGGTLNNPHIPGSHFRDWERIEKNHAARLRELVVDALAAEEDDRPPS